MLLLYNLNLQSSPITPPPPPFTATQWIGLSDQQLQSEIQYTLLETPNGGFSYNSGLYTSTEVQARLTYRLFELAKRTGYLANRSTAFTALNSTLSAAIPTDCIDILRLGYPDASGVIWSIPRGSTAEAQVFAGSLLNSTQDVPYIYTTDTSAGVPQIVLYPAPTVGRAIDYIYIQRPLGLPLTPDGTVMNLPKDLCPFVKYGALADLFNKTGEAYDPQRAAICQQMFDLGIQVIQSYTYGTLQ